MERGTVTERAKAFDHSSAQFYIAGLENTAEEMRFFVDDKECFSICAERSYP